MGECLFYVLDVAVVDWDDLVDVDDFFYFYYEAGVFAGVVYDVESFYVFCLHEVVIHEYADGGYVEQEVSWFSSCGVYEGCCCEYEEYAEYIISCDDC